MLFITHCLTKGQRLADAAFQPIRPHSFADPSASAQVDPRTGDLLRLASNYRYRWRRASKNQPSQWITSLSLALMNATVQPRSTTVTGLGNPSFEALACACSRRYSRGSTRSASSSGGKHFRVPNSTLSDAIVKTFPTSCFASRSSSDVISDASSAAFNRHLPITLRSWLSPACTGLTTLVKASATTTGNIVVR